MKTKHTPTPWKISPHTNPGTAWTIESESGFICDGWGPGSSLDDANAQFIVQACNHHEELVAVLDELCREVKVLEMFGETGSTATQENVDIAVLKASSLLTKLKG